MDADTIAVLTSGGDAPGMNAAVRAVVKVAASQGVCVTGIEEGYTGLLQGRSRPLSRRSGDVVLPDPELDFWGSLGGTVLGSARELRFLTPEGRAPAIENLRGARGLVVIGGNGSLAGAEALAREAGVPVVGIPASIDHDVGCTRASIGVDTALNTIVTACDRICDTATAHHRAFVVEVMGRDSGYLAMAASIAAGADAVLFREQGRDEQEIVAALERVIVRAFTQERGKRRVLVLKAEGVKVPCTRLVRKVQARLEQSLPRVEVRATVLGHLVRGGHPSFRDRMISGRMGLAAVRAILAGRTGMMTGWDGPATVGEPTDDPSVRLYPLPVVLRESQALVDGSSPLTQRRVHMMEAIEGVLGL